MDVTPVDSSTVYHTASLSKQFTAIGVKLLEKEGKIDLDEDIRTILPEIVKLKEKVTIRQLICHTGGLRDQWELLSSGPWRREDLILQEDILNLVSHQRELNSEPESEIHYCSTGYTLLAALIEKIEVMPFPQF